MNVQMSSKICIPNIGIVENVMDFLIPILVLIPLLEFESNYSTQKTLVSEKCSIVENPIESIAKFEIQRERQQILMRKQCSVSD